MSSTKENHRLDEKSNYSKGVRFHENCKIEDGGPDMKQSKKIPPPAVLNTIVFPKLEDI